MEKILRLKIYVDGGVNDTPFPNVDTQIEIGEFRYDAKRMGGAPTITATVMHPTCLDNVWTNQVYAEFNGEKYYLKQTPTSSYSNEDARYRHDIELISERVVLDNVYFYDAVSEGDIPSDDKPISNSTKVVFWGDIEQFKDRLNASLRHSGIDYVAVVDKDVTSEEKLVSFEDAFFSNAIQEAYNTFDIPYYFVGKTIHFGYSDDVVIPTLEYGVDSALLSISKNNANFKVVNRVTGEGSSDNIPFYYPNNSPKGDIIAKTSPSSLEVQIRDYEKFSYGVDLDSSLEYNIGDAEVSDVIRNGYAYEIDSVNKIDYFDYKGFTEEYRMNVLSYKKNAKFAIMVSPTFLSSNFEEVDYRIDVTALWGGKAIARAKIDSRREWVITLPFGSNAGKKKDLTLRVKYSFANNDATLTYSGSTRLYASGDSKQGWFYKDKEVTLSEMGLYTSQSNIPDGATITQELVKYVKTSQVLMPSRYRETDAKERFYNAVNGVYDGYVFKNPFVEGKPKEHIVTVDDIKPTIKETTVNGLRIDMFSEFAYDRDDNDETYEDENGNVNFKHPYFYGKLRRMDFNLFDHAIESQPMTISFTSGNVGACNFEIGVTEEYPQKNPVQVDKNGNLVYDENGMVLCGLEGTKQVISEYQPSQQDTINNEVWIALRKEEETYGILMPIEAHRPKACSEGKNDGDTFVILGINLPKSYILNAEKRLEDEIIKYMKENNDEKFNFSISFSRIYFEENPEVLKSISENSRISVRYNDKVYPLYVNSFSYQMSEGDILPQISVELDEALTISQNALQHAINEVKSDIGKAISGLDVLGIATPFFLRKDADDEANGRVNFRKGIKFGEGGKVDILDGNSAKLTIDYLEVTKKATFTSLEIQEKTHVGGQMLVTPASLNCKRVEESEGHYRCYFQTKGEDGDEIFNQFAVGDQAVCQTFNSWGSKYYWRLVVGVGEDYIDLSKTECDEGSDIPSEGDKIIQLGNQVDEARQNAIVIAAHGDGSPYIIQYKGINSFELTDNKIVTKLSSTENIFTGKVHMELGSDGLENIEGGLNIGGQNMLRNSGFTGNFLSEAITDNMVMEDGKPLYSDPLDFWFSEDYPASNAEVVDSEVASSGKEVSLANGSITQELYQRVIRGEAYVLSFKAKGTRLTYSVGGVTKTIELTNEWVRYVEKFEAASHGDIFAITNATCSLCDLQLERGTMATSWGVSPLDNSSDRSYYQALKYLSDAMEQGSTDVLGGLVLTNHIKVGNYANKVMTKETAGMNGTYSTDDSVAFWGGGSLDMAIATIAKYKDNPKYKPTEEEFKSMVNFAVTHGGRIIANDAIIRGTIYAEDGEFSGRIVANGGEIGKLKIFVDRVTGEAYVRSENECHLGRSDMASFTNEGFYSMSAYNVQEAVCNVPYQASLLGLGFRSTRNYRSAELEQDADEVADIYIDHNVDEFDGSETSIKVNSGMFEGLRPKTRVVASIRATLTEFDHSILVRRSDGTSTIWLPDSPKDGQEYMIESMGAKVEVGSDTDNIFVMSSGTYTSFATHEGRGILRLKYYADNDTWTCTVLA